MERLVLGVYEDHAGVRVVRVVTIVHTRNWQVGTVLQTTGQEGTSRHGAVPLHGRHREGDPLVVEVGGEVVDVIGSGKMDVPMSGGIQEESGEEKMVMEPWW